MSFAVNLIILFIGIGFFLALIAVIRFGMERIKKSWL